MSDFLETLKLRLADAQRRHLDATRILQTAQANHQAVTQEVFSWKKAVEVETRKEVQQAAMRHAQEVNQQGISPPAVPVPPIPASQPKSTHVMPAGSPSSAPNLQATIAASVPSQEAKSEFNKAEAIRDLLRQHPEGMRPADVWRCLKDQVRNRVYVYAVLKRLKDSNRAVEKRGRYFLREAQKTDDVLEETLNIQ